MSQPAPLSLAEADTAGIMIPAWVDDTLMPYDKLAVHCQGLRHKAISVFVVAGDAVLLQRRARHKYHTPGLWANACCTHPAWSEEAGTCASRRLEEELGITGLELEHRGQVEYRADVGQGLIEHEVVEVFLAQAPANLPIVPNPQEAMAIRWVRFDALLAEIEARPERFTPWLRIYLAQHRAMIFGDRARAL